jgi:hypothetical protein
LRLYAQSYILTTVKLEWDRAKAATNLRKHGVSFADAATVLHDKYALTVSDDEPSDAW